MSQVTEASVRFQTDLASIKLIQASAALDLTEDDFDFLTSNKVWIATDRSRARRCVEACVSCFFFSSRRRHTRSDRDWSSDVCSSDLGQFDGLHFKLTKPGLIGDLIGGPARTFWLGVLVLASLVLLATCTNLASMFTARAAEDRKSVV